MFSDKEESSIPGPKLPGWAPSTAPTLVCTPYSVSPFFSGGGPLNPASVDSADRRKTHLSSAWR